MRYHENPRRDKTGWNNNGLGNVISKENLIMLVMVDTINRPRQCDNERMQKSSLRIVEWHLIRQHLKEQLKIRV